VGGIGMSGIAEVFLNQGFKVSGSDLNDSDTTRRLAQLGVEFFKGHQAANIPGADVVVISSAVSASNPEVIEARRLRIPVIKRAEMLAELMRGKVGVAVAGTHGKTTTTSMMAHVFSSAGLDPTLVIGGKVDALGGNAKLGQGQFVVAEADESDGSFLQLPATYGVITNIDNDHMDHYGSMGAIDDAFVSFVGNIPFYGLAAVCGDDPGVARCLERFGKPFVTYGFGEQCDYQVRDWTTSGLGSRFEVYSAKQGRLGEIELKIPGRHNVLNALSVVALSLGVGLTMQEIARGLAEFTGVKRRFEIRWQDQTTNRVIVDDYGHHPTEIAATLSAARQFWKGRIIVAFQPHRYTRTLHCRDGFLTAFDQADEVIVSEIYAAGEAPIAGISAEALVEDLSRRRPHVSAGGDLAATEKKLLELLQPGDLVLCMGAGSITKLPAQLMSALQGRS
jgi:UDP-N-acetylmuramate--alanine ligase